MSNYYNENDRYAAEWLRTLVAAGHLPAGDIDTRSIADVDRGDLRGYQQCHFFAGIGGWPYALRLARWPDDISVWTGSCPCQPLSAAGQQKGHADERHLWPAFYDLIAECRPATIFGEQVASALGREWLSGVRADLEAARYAVGAADLCAASVSAPHIRQRLFWVGITNGARSLSREQAGTALGYGNTAIATGYWGNTEWLQCIDGKARRIEPGIRPLAHGVSGRVGRLRGYGNAIVPQIAAEFIAAFCETRGSPQ